MTNNANKNTEMITAFFVSGKQKKSSVSQNSVLRMGKTTNKTQQWIPITS